MTVMREARPQNAASVDSTSPDRSAVVGPTNGVPGLLWVYPRRLFSPLSGPLLTVGRGDDVSVTLDDSAVSRRHAAVQRQGRLLVLRDLGSRNGTRKNGEPIVEAALSTGDVVRLGGWIAVVCELDPTSIASQSYFIETDGVLIGPSMQPVWRYAEQLASGSLPLLIEGPTGTGKEVLTRAIHRFSGRTGPLVAVNCAALPEALVEAQLFGHARGSFTGAIGASEGLIGSADGGTLLLDEIVDLPLGQQAKLLRVLEERNVLRVGETAPRPVDVRFLAACQQPLWTLVETGAFRADLLARLAGGSIRLPPLRERREEIVPLFLRFFTDAGGNPNRAGASFLEVICTAPWPFNIRQLLQFARLAAATLAGISEMGSGHAEALLRTLDGRNTTPPAAARQERDSERLPRQHSSERAEPEQLGARRYSWLRRNQTELDALSRQLAANGGNVSKASEALGISRSRAHRLLEAQRCLLDGSKRAN